MPGNLIAFLLSLSACLVPNLAAADPETREYAAQLLEVEARQWRSGDRALRYADVSELKGLLDPQRIEPLISRSVAESYADAAEPDLVKMLGPVMKRYETAFNREPKLYEVEYLDVVAVAEILLRDWSARTNASRAPRTETPLGNAQEQQVIAAMSEIADNTRLLTQVVRRRTAEELRKKIAAGLFTAEGSRRADALATKLMP